ncbi:hypothetical protein A2U01_0110897, partial [Trifolium medium]|nr:hypothetical protein [Trifolium medium]
AYTATEHLVLRSVAGRGEMSSPSLAMSRQLLADILFLKSLTLARRG